MAKLVCEKTFAVFTVFMALLIGNVCKSTKSYSDNFTTNSYFHSKSESFSLKYSVIYGTSNK